MPIPFVDREMELTQPDGSTIDVLGTGNQFRATFRTLDGQPLAFDADTGWSVAQTDLAKHISATSQQGERSQSEAHSGLHKGECRWEKRLASRKQEGLLKHAKDVPLDQPSGWPATGKVVGLTILIEFSDQGATIPREKVERYCNQTGYSDDGNNGSVRDYFLEVSEQKLDYSNIVLDYVQAPKPLSYYNDTTANYPDRAHELIRWALNEHISNGFDPSKLTLDSNGDVRALNVLYAGTGPKEWSKGLWPHQHSLAQPVIAPSGEVFSDYQITDMRDVLTLGTFCHENGHLVCDFPDLYDYDDGAAASRGVGRYCLMGGGGGGTFALDRNPVHVCAYLKMYAGWYDSFIPIVSGHQIVLDSSKNDFALLSKNDTEYFVIENRQKLGRDAELPDDGLAIWHVDEHGSNDWQERLPTKHYECSLEQADGWFDLESDYNDGDTTDLYSDVTGVAFDKQSKPDSRWWDGSESGLTLADISRSSSLMSFEVL